jgi:hypothetical protein
LGLSGVQKRQTRAFDGDLRFPLVGREQGQSSLELLAVEVLPLLIGQPCALAGTELLDRARKRLRHPLPDLRILKRLLQLVVESAAVDTADPARVGGQSLSLQHLHLSFGPLAGLYRGLQLTLADTPTFWGVPRVPRLTLAKL